MHDHNCNYYFNYNGKKMQIKNDVVAFLHYACSVNNNTVLVINHVVLIGSYKIQSDSEVGNGRHINLKFVIWLYKTSKISKDRSGDCFVLTDYECSLKVLDGNGYNSTNGKFIKTIKLRGDWIESNPKLRGKNGSGRVSGKYKITRYYWCLLNQCCYTAIMELSLL